MIRTLAVALSGLALIGCAHVEDWQVQESERRIVLPGTLDLAVIEGSFIPNDCQLETIFRTREVAADCVAFPSQASQDFQALYVRALSDQGWRFAGGAANAFFFERPQPNTDCSDRLNFVGWLLGDPEEIAKYGRQEEPTMDWSRITHQSFIMAVEPVPVCGDERDAQ